MAAGPQADVLLLRAVGPGALAVRRLATACPVPGRSLQSTSSEEVGEFWCARTGALLFALSKALITSSGRPCSGPAGEASVRKLELELQPLLPLVHILQLSRRTPEFPLTISCLFLAYVDPFSSTNHACSTCCPRYRVCSSSQATLYLGRGTASPAPRRAAVEGAVLLLKPRDLIIKS